MKKWLYRTMILCICIGVGTGAYLFQKYGSLLTNTPAESVVVEAMAESDKNFMETMETYVGKDFVQHVQEQMQSGIGDGDGNSLAGENTQNGEVSGQGTSPMKQLQQGVANGKKPQQGDLIRSHIEALLSVKDQFDSKLEVLIKDAKKEYIALPQAERTTDNKVKVGLKYADRAISLESQADAEIYGIISHLELELKKYDYDTSVIQEIKDYYEQQKELQRNFYLAKLKS